MYGATAATLPSGESQNNLPWMEMRKPTRHSRTIAASFALRTRLIPWSLLNDKICSPQDLPATLGCCWRPLQYVVGEEQGCLPAECTFLWTASWRQSWTICGLAIGSLLTPISFASAANPAGEDFLPDPPDCTYACWLGICMSTPVLTQCCGSLSNPDYNVIHF